MTLPGQSVKLTPVLNIVLIIFSLRSSWPPGLMVLPSRAAAEDAVRSMPRDVQTAAWELKVDWRCLRFGDDGMACLSVRQLDAADLLRASGP